MPTSTYRYLVLGQACFHLGLIEDAMVLLQTGRRLASVAFRRESVCWSDDSFSSSSSSATAATPCVPSGKTSSSGSAFIIPTTESEAVSQLLAHVKLLLRRRAAAMAALDAGLSAEAVRHAAHLESLSIDPGRHLLYSYSAAAHGFVAALLPVPEVLQVVPDEMFQLHTTRFPEFLGLLTPAYRPAMGNLEAATHDVVIGVLDTGVWPESPSFAGGNLPPSPARWKGVCEAGVDFPSSLCGRKLVGACSFSRGLRAANGGAIGVGKRTFRSARDRDGHGTHTATTAAGAVVANASLLGYATGTARRATSTPIPRRRRSDGDNARRRLRTGTVNSDRILISVYAAPSAVLYPFWSLSVVCVSKI
jgi:hypothetical protein